MKKTFLAAGLLCLLVLGGFGISIKAFGKQSLNKDQEGASEVAAATKFVPPLERINQERDEEARNAEDLRNENSGTYYHTKAKEPDVKIYQTLYKGGTQVRFDHTLHAESMGLNCIECHHVERCSKCHTSDKTHSIPVVTSKQAFHENCIGCHSEAGGPQLCADCHKQ